MIWTFTSVAEPQRQVNNFGDPWKVQYIVDIDSVGGTVGATWSFAGHEPIVFPPVPVRIVGDSIWLAQEGRPETLWFRRSGARLIWDGEGTMPDGTEELAVFRGEFERD